MVKLSKKQNKFFLNEQSIEEVKRKHNITLHKGVMERSNTAFNLMCTLYGEMLFYSDKSKSFLFPGIKTFLKLRKFTKEVVDKKFYKNFGIEQQDIFIDVLLFIHKNYSFKGCSRLAEEIAGSIINDKKISLLIRLITSAKLIKAKIHYKKNLEADKLDLMEEIRHKYTRKILGLEKDYRDTLIRVARLIDDKEILKAIEV